MSRNLWRTHGRMNFPIDSLILYIPFGHPELNGSPFTSKDLNAFTCTVTGATHVPPTHRLFAGDDDVAFAVSVGKGSCCWREEEEWQDESGAGEG